MVSLKGSANTQLLLEQLYDLVAAKMQPEFYSRWAFEKEEPQPPAWFRMVILRPCASTAVAEIIRRFLQQNMENRKIILSKVLSKENAPWTEDFSPEKLAELMGTDTSEAKTIAKIVKEVLLNCGIFNRPQKFIVDQNEFTVQLYK